MDNLKFKISSLPQSPGVYQFLDKNGRVLYIGKAKNLRARIRQYFAGNDERPQIPFLMKEVANLDYTIVNTELESLYLERTLIQEHYPKYNIELKDDKSYGFIVIDYSTEIPQVVIRRRPNEDNFKFSPFAKASEDKQISNFKKNHKSDFFGPYTSIKKIRDLIFTARKIFGLCAAKKIGKPCFYFHLRRCPGVCAGVMSFDDYRKHLEKIKQFLLGKIEPIIRRIKTEMKNAAAVKKFEKAAGLRDQLRAIEMLEEKQNMIMAKPVNWDILGLFADEGFACVNLFKIRQGKMLDKENFIFKTITSITHGREFYKQQEILQNFLETYYSETGDCPKKIFIPSLVSNSMELDTKIIAKLLQKRFDKNISFKMPIRGKAAKLAALSQTNAKEYLKNYLNEKAGHFDKIQRGLFGLKEILKLPTIPRRIEGYDISNIQGTNAVGSMVVFENGLPAKSQYRKFKIKSRIVSAEGLPKADDFAMMKEILERRVLRIKNQESSKTDKTHWPLPDLMVIDGGRGQLNAAIAVLKTISYLSSEALAKGGTLNAIPVIGLAKRIEEIFVPGRKQPILLPTGNPALHLLQRLRDETHRFAITFHRDLRSKQAVKSALDDILGVGPKTKKLLKQHFGTVANVREASVDELAEIVGKKLANVIKQNL